ncbi:uncharacterized protein EV422DRAFT_129499 [Fimicolochytrium jonesii]|uniref:uncharacterized protein n=1 Tax=Fimicolochytrium jonesii TaxID=1396493 RepID=UPI0022FEBA69|nr:uncharacterized protein EV422DRAFT_129499 [Fimicolochytrium jonesii]KAI8818998.1 hypothetical protein EV422DRAFT_129499 [Fimicolochytrium jonesii]
MSEMFHAQWFGGDERSFSKPAPISYKTPESTPGSLLARLQLSTIDTSKSTLYRTAAATGPSISHNPDTNTPRNPVPSLPIELWVHICRLLTTDPAYQPALYSLCLVNKALSLTATEYLYKYPRIDGLKQSNLFLHSLALSTSAAVANLTNTDPSAALDGRGSLRDAASYVKGLQRTRRTPSGFLIEVAHRAHGLELFPPGFWERLNSSDLEVLARCRATVATLVIGTDNKDALLALASILAAREYTHMSRRRSSLSLEDYMCTLQQKDPLRDALDEMLPTDRKLAYLLIHLPNIRRLALSDQAVTAGPDPLIHLAVRCLPNLRSVTLDSSGVAHSRVGPAAVKTVWENCVNLADLTLVNHTLPATIPLSPAKQLRRLRLRHCTFAMSHDDSPSLSTHTLPHMIINAPGLTHLELHKCNDTDTDTSPDRDRWSHLLGALASHLPPTLTHLAIIHTHPTPTNLSNIPITPLVTSFTCLPTLRTLHIESLVNVTPAALTALLTHTPNITTLNLNRCHPSATDHHFAAVCTTLPKLTGLCYLPHHVPPGLVCLAMPYVPDPADNHTTSTGLAFSSSVNPTPSFLTSNAPPALPTNTTPRIHLPHTPRLTHLTLDAGAWTEDGWRALADACPRLRSVGVVGVVGGRVMGGLRRRGVRVVLLGEGEGGEDERGVGFM